jgi:hypothetical protein
LKYPEPLPAENGQEVIVASRDKLLPPAQWTVKPGSFFRIAQPTANRGQDTVSDLRLATAWLAVMTFRRFIAASTRCRRDLLIDAFVMETSII